MDIGSIWDFAQIVLADIVLSGDNALIIGLAAAGLAPELRKKAIMFGRGGHPAHYLCDFRHLSAGGSGPAVPGRTSAHLGMLAAVRRDT